MARHTWLPMLRGIGSVVLATTLGAGCCPCSAPSPGSATAIGGTGPLAAGAATVDVLLPAGTPLAGYGGSPRRELNAQTIPLTAAALFGGCFDPDPTTPATFFEPSQGTLDPITARALVLANGAHTVAIVTLDTVAVSAELRSDVATAAAALGIPKRAVVLLATHTHSGPGGIAHRPLWQVIGADCLAEPVYAAVRDAAVQALTDAHAALQPAALGVGVATESGASKNRRGRPGVYDPEIGIVKVTTTAGDPIAALVDFAVHGTAYGHPNMFFSADCMGEIEAVVEQGLPGAVAIFANGAEGDVGPIKKNLAGVKLIGQLVGGAVVSAWPGIATTTTLDLRSAYLMVDMPPPTFNTGAGCTPVPGTSASLCDLIPGLTVQMPLQAAWVPTRLPFQAVRLGSSVLVAVAGEPITELGWALKTYASSHGFAHGFVLALANDYAGYFTTCAEYDRGEYEGRSTLYGRSTGEVVRKAAIAVMDAV